MSNNNGQESAFKKVLKAHSQCQAGRQKSLECVKFDYRQGYELTKLARDIKNKTYTPSKGKCFWVTAPKNREIWASAFRDRIVHHLIVDPLEKIQEPQFISQSFACRKGRGPFQALKELQKQVRRISQGGQKIVHALQLDLRSFFVSIDRNILHKNFLETSRKPLINKKIDYPYDLQFLINQNFSHDLRLHYNQSTFIPDSIPEEEYRKKSWSFRPKDQGIPIGNLTSQFGANLYLNSLDHYIQRKLKPKGYLRYMDDLLLLDTDPDFLRPLENIIQHYLEIKLKHSLNFQKTEFRPLTKGITYLGYICRQDFNTKEPLQIYPTKKKKWQLIDEIKKIESKVNYDKSENFLNQKLDPNPLSLLVRANPNQLSSLNSRLGILKHTNCGRFKKHALEKMEYNLTEFRDEPSEVSQKYCPVKIRKDFNSVKFK